MTQTIIPIMIRYKFSTQNNREFAHTLRKRVNAYFKENNINRKANGQMVGKSILAISMHVVPFILIISGWITSIPILFGLWVIMGVGTAFTGMSVMHDALHGSYAKSKGVNFIMGLSAYLIGANPKNWQIQHNVLHHTYTNIEHADDDITPRFVMRFTPHQPRKWFHRFQHIYAPVLYGISTFLWVLNKDFSQLYGYYKKNLIKKEEFRRQMGINVVHKSIYWLIVLGLPILILPFPFWLTVLMFLSMHYVTGIILTLVFQTAHVIPDNRFVLQDSQQIEENWTVHQMLTTTNSAMNSKFVTWFTGGLNHQIEHHLFPNVCHVHYPDIAPIVRQTAEEYGIPYQAHPSFGSAVADHFRLLHHLGRNNTLEAA